jgi:hypothetical protein
MSIQMPRRSVTRFFIPLIDVLILMFCIFLLMPIVEEGAEGPGGAKVTAAEADVLRRQIDQLRKQVTELEATRESPRTRDLERENELLRQQASRAIGERLVIRAFEIDPKSGTLTYQNPERVEVQNQADAKLLMDRDLRDLTRRDEDSKGVKHQLYYLIITPRDPDNPFPKLDQRQRIADWFRDQRVSVGWDFPRRGPGGGRLQ